MLLSAQSIRTCIGIHPWHERSTFKGMSFGLSGAGYDIRIEGTITGMGPGEFYLATTVEEISLPNDVLGMLVDKSTWARRGVAVQNTVFEPGWHGYPTLEISNHGLGFVNIYDGSPIAQMLFFRLDEPTEQPYRGKYQNQPQRPVEALEE